MSDMVDTSATHGTPYVNPKFDGNNFLEWSRACMMALKTHKLMKYVNGKAKKPLETDASFDDWDSENAIVSSWLLNSMEVQIRKNYIFSDTAEEVWNSINRTYSFSGNVAKPFEVKRKIWALVQGGRTLAQYYSDLTSLWKELDHYTIFICKQAEDQEKYQKMVTEERVMKFLDGLSVEYDSIKNQLIGHVPFPTVEEAYCRVQLEEIRKKSMAPTAPFDRSVFGGTTAPRFPRNSGDQMNMEDSMAEDPVHSSNPAVLVFGQPLVSSSNPTVPVFGQPLVSSSNPTVPMFGQPLVSTSNPTVPMFGQPLVSPSPPGFMFGSAAPSSISPAPFQFGGQQNQATPQNLPLFQPSSSLVNCGGSLSFGSGGGDKGGRKMVRVSKNKNRRK